MRFHSVLSCLITYTSTFVIYKIVGQKKTCKYYQIYIIYIQIQKNWKNTSYKLDIQAISKNIF